MFENEQRFLGCHRNKNPQTVNGKPQSPALALQTHNQVWLAHVGDAITLIKEQLHVSLHPLFGMADYESPLNLHCYMIYWMAEFLRRAFYTGRIDRSNSRFAIF
jgi:hypothetical protein